MTAASARKGLTGHARRRRFADEATSSATPACASTPSPSRGRKAGG
ncbi:MAG TPA: hypothetical protein VGK67_40105 [Myxococcales bacterium]|jgi:hypothetical protein